jgi:hypothetical protein
MVNSCHERFHKGDDGMRHWWKRILAMMMIAALMVMG